jgi:hypothetical protein
VATVGEDTAPKSAPSHEDLRASTVSSGRATPVFWKVSHPAWWWLKSNFRPNELGSASRIRRPAGMTSRPMPSPGMRPGWSVSGGLGQLVLGEWHWGIWKLSGGFARNVPILSVREAMIEAVVLHESFVSRWKFWCCYAADTRTVRASNARPLGDGMHGYSEDPVGYDISVLPTLTTVSSFLCI